MKKAQDTLSIAALLLLLLTSLGISCHASAATNVNDFTISQYRINYTLSRDSAGRSSLRTVESIDALFPSYDQNHGIERAIPKTYDNHSTSLKISSVTDETGRARHYSTYGSNNNLVVRIGDANAYAHGLQHYVITYTQRDVTRYFANTNSDEFYWDTDGTSWSVPISTLTVTLHIANALKTHQTGKQQCYVGAEGSTSTCDLTPTSDGYSLQANNLSPGENATLAVGFKPHSFAAYSPTTRERLVVIWGISLAITSFVSCCLIVWYIVRYWRKSNRSAERTTIVPQYVPPEDTSLAVAASIYRKYRAVF